MIMLLHSNNDVAVQRRSIRMTMSVCVYVFQIKASLITHSFDAQELLLITSFVWSCNARATTTMDVKMIMTYGLDLEGDFVCRRVDSHDEHKRSLN